MVRIRITTNPGQITGEPMPFNLAVKTLHSDFDIHPMVWEYVDEVTDRNGWTYRLIYC